MESVYPAGMLDRDQRTAKIRLCQCRCSDMEVPNRTSSFTSDASTKISSIFSSIVFNKKRTKFSYLIWKKGYLIHTYNFPRVKNVVLVLVYLTLTMMNSASTAPAPKDDKWWESPCGSSPEPAEPLSTTPPQEFNKWHLSDLLIQAQYNLIQANHLKDSFGFFTGSTLGNNSKDHKKKYDWMELQPNQPTDWEIGSFHMGKEVMKDIHRALQMTALAFDIIIDEGGEPAKLFLAEKHSLQYLLCHMEAHLRDRNLRPRAVDADFLEKIIKNKHTSAQEKDIRNYMVYTNYTETLHLLEDFIFLFQKIGFEVQKLENKRPEDENVILAKLGKIVQPKRDRID
ncbi:uncharacterized protein LOC126888265 isoform X2 [Diabrotica virgifera virgifera]|uniref:Uncharacterized protein n=2 Tax=Diabrotica virgifera virgifera TaxID=50390 RepID=A0ABM5KQ58_DIAVI|nr:uncharacterized protein LOC126888265 isoform X2 [Diabrotica virgifera virgifera]